MNRTRFLLPAVWIAFFASGTAGLVYEVVWARYLDLVLGGTAYAHIMVLAAYMGGLALGAWFFGRLADRFSEPLVVYAYLEMAIGLYALAFPTLFSLGSGFYLLLAEPLGTVGIGGVVNKFIISVLLLGPSTFLMGGTLPLLTRAVTALPERVGRRVSGLYFINSLGAVCGALIAGFILIPGLGVRATLTAAAALNIAIGISLLVAWRYGGLVRDRSDESLGEEPAGQVDLTRQSEKAGQGGGEFEGVAERRLALWAAVAVWGAGLSGMVVMVYEVSWIRLLSTILGSSTYSFTLMLAAFITGIALGSLVARWLARFTRPFLFFGVSQFLVGASLLLALPLYAGLPYIFLGLQSIAARTEGGYLVYEAVKYLFCLAVMLPPTLASGAALPLATDVAARLSRRVGQSVGRVYAVNTLGTIVGALLGGLVLLPVLGIKLTLEVGIVVNMAFGLWVLFLHPWVGAGRLRGLGMSAAALIVVYILVAPAWDLRALASGVFRERQDVGPIREQFKERISDLEVVFYEEDVNSTVAVLRRNENFSLIVNGKADASTYMRDSVTQTLIAAISAMMVPSAKRALVIGLGSGQTAGHLLQYPVQRVEVVEISPGVVRASRFFDHMNGRPLDDPRTVLVTQDAKTYLLTRPHARYDLILSEPSNPWIAGIGGLFTVEYFSAMKERLEPGGVMAQWIHTYEQNDETLGCVLLTFCEAFPYVTVWGMSVTDLVLVGSNEPVSWDFESSRTAFQRPGVAADLARISMGDLFTLLNQQLMSPLRVAEVTSLGGRLNTNNFPFLEYQAPRIFFLNTEATLHALFDERNWTLRNTGLELARYLEGREPTPAELVNSIDCIRDTGGMLPRLEASATAAWLEMEPDTPAGVEEAILTGYLSLKASVDKTAKLARDDPNNHRYLKMYAKALLDAYDLTRSVVYRADGLAAQLLEVLPRAAELVAEERKYYLYRLGQVFYDQGRYDETVETMTEVVDLLGASADPTGLLRLLQPGKEEIPANLGPTVDPRMPPDYVLIYLGRALLKLERYEEALEVFRRGYELNPRNPVVSFYFAELHKGFTSGRYFSLIPQR